MTAPRIERALSELYGDLRRPSNLTKLRGDASTRSYYRATFDGAPANAPSRLIVMQLPEGAFGSDEGGSDTRTERLPFLEVAELLATRGVPVPAVYATDLEHGVILLEDLGGTTFHQLLLQTPRADWPDLYGRAVDLLAEMHDRCGDLPAASIVARRRFDRALLDWELDHFREWGLEAELGTLSEPDAVGLREEFDEIASTLESMPEGFVHRDYQSKNLMVGADGALTVIDFQDALRGPRVYDLVALLCDSYVALDAPLQEAMIARYAALRRIDPDLLCREFWWVALHRKLKDAGRFIFIDRVRRNPAFLQWFPQSLVYVGRAVERIPEMGSLGARLSGLIPGFPDAVQKPSSRTE